MTLRVCQAALTGSLIWQVILQKEKKGEEHASQIKNDVLLYSQPTRLCYMRIVAKIVGLTRSYRRF